ncbi:zinc finger CCCH domain-containing protein 66 [Cicer arietinum]|uniref:Zinc finger CCCH domain-containing protein 66 n=1 Tax=Cicer arietinum TaxID=3827 RepID=A0A1S2Y6M8_CICAR|nr:zinc finger CCCH domain-containing protein 66 [Cicer arietinum]XP_027190021.1 zinc finger CCCH domain-containing protein 66 [Cicer arietinum]
MCSGSSPKPSPSGLIEEHEYERQEELHQKVSALLEFSATDDLMAFKDAVEKDDHGVDEVGLWYGRKIGSKEMSYEERTPLMIAALFGSKGVLSYILGTGRVHVNRRCGSDGATALHCAVFGCSANSPEVIKLLLDASADVSSVDANGNRSSDLIDSVSNSIFGSRKRILQAILEGTDDVDVVDDDDYFKEEKQQPNAGTPRIEKKDYPIDLSLPDIKNGIYSSDEFRMFSFKVKTCSRAYSHDWTECPFVHPGENARRRDPKKYHYTCVPCPEFRKGSCSKGDGCEYAHGIFECWLHPAQYRTRLCKDETECTRRVCFFAHKPEELRPLYASTGSALPSPRSVDPYTLNSPSSLIQRASTPPLTPSAASSPMNGTMLWQTQLHSAAVPTLQMPRSRLKTSLNVRDTDLDMELLELENRLMRKLMMEEMAAGISTPSKWQNSMPNSPSYPVSLTDHMGESNRFSGVNPTNLEDIFASHFQSPNGMQNVNQQLWGYPSDVTTSNRIGSPPFMADPSMNPRYAAFSKRSQSFIERGVASFNSELPSVTSVAAEPSSTFSSWGSSNGKLDWSICGDELNKMRKSYSFAFQNRNSSTSTMAATAVPPNDGEPDVSWVNSLVKDAPTMEYDQCCVED